MHRRTLRRAAVLAAVAWLITILSAELLHAVIESESQAAHRQCPVCLFHSTHGQIHQPEAVLKPVLLLALVESAPLPAYSDLAPRSYPAFHRSIRAPPLHAL
jgi:hypothetical protein